MSRRIGGADIVVVGTVTARVAATRFATIAVEEQWKGVVDHQVDVYGGPSQDNTATDVDRTYQVGIRYLVFAFEPATHGSSGTFGGRYEDTSCSATQPWTESLTQFRPTTATITPPPTTSSSAPLAPSSAGADNTTPWFIAIAAAAAAIGLTVAVGRRRRATT